MSAEESIRATIDMLTEAWNKNDMGTFLSLFTDDADYISGAGVWLRGRDAIRDQFSNNQTSSGKNDQVFITESMIKLVKADVAVVHCTWAMKSNSIQEGQSRHGVISQVLSLDGDRWRIAALHNTDCKENVGSAD